MLHAYLESGSGLAPLFSSTSFVIPDLGTSVDLSHDAAGVHSLTLAVENDSTLDLIPDTPEVFCVFLVCEYKNSMIGILL